LFENRPEIPCLDNKADEWNYKHKQSNTALSEVEGNHHFSSNYPDIPVIKANLMLHYE